MTYTNCTHIQCINMFSFRIITQTLSLSFLPVSPLLSQRLCVQWLLHKLCGLGQLQHCQRFQLPPRPGESGHMIVTWICLWAHDCHVTSPVACIMNLLSYKKLVNKCCIFSSFLTANAQFACCYYILSLPSSPYVGMALGRGLFPSSTAPVCPSQRCQSLGQPLNDPRCPQHSCPGSPGLPLERSSRANQQRWDRVRGQLPRASLVHGHHTRCPSRPQTVQLRATARAPPPSILSTIQYLSL